MKKNLSQKSFSSHLILASTLSLTLASIALSGCGSAFQNTSASSYVAETTAYDMAENSNSAISAEGMPASFSKSASADFAAAEEVAPADQSSILNAEDSLAQAPSQDAQTISERKLIRNVNLDLETREFDALTKAISDAVTSFGGYIEQSDVSGTSLTYSGNRSQRYSNITARIPSDHLDAFLTEVSNQGNVTYKNESIQDVTLQYTDISSRKKTLQLEQTRLWELLEKAESVDAVIALESRLSEVRYQIESLESQLRTLDNQIVYSTVSISIQEVQVLTSTDPDRITTRIQKGLSRSIYQLQTSFVNFVVWFVSSLPILVVAVVLILLALLIFRVLRKKVHCIKNWKNRKQIKKEEEK